MDIQLEDRYMVEDGEVGDRKYAAWPHTGKDNVWF